MQDTKLFEPLDVGNKLRLPNRIVMAPMTTQAGEPDGSFSDEEIAYLGRRAESGVGLLMTPACYCHKSGHAFKRQVGCHSDDMLPSLSRCASAINKHGAASFVQLHHGGNAAKSAYIGHPPWAPSAVKNRSDRSEMPDAMTEEQIETVIQSFVDGARRVREAGFTGIEIHGANTYLLQQFFSPLTNKRTDKWGCENLANRARFASEVVSAVRGAVGPNYPVAYRISPEEPDPDGYSVYDAIELLKIIIPKGIDIVHVSSWEYGIGVRSDYPDDSHPTLEIRRALPQSVPMIGVGGISHPEQAVRVLNDGIEMAALGRTLLINPDWVQLVKHGREDEIREKVETQEELSTLDLPKRMKDYMRRWWFPKE